MRTRAHLDLALLAGIAVLMCISVAHIPGAAVGLEYLGPSLLVFLLLRLGRYPGERAILAAIRRAPPLQRARTIGAPRRRAEGHMPRGGRLLATSLAGRAPPLSTEPY